MAMAKNPKRVAAGRKAWAKKTASQKAAAIRRLKGGARAAKSGKGTRSRGAGRMAKGNSKRQGIASWATSWVQLILSLANPIIRAGEAYDRYGDGQKLNGWLRFMVKDYTGAAFDEDWRYINWDAKRMIRGYAPPLAGYAIKKTTMMMMKGNKLSLIPKLR